MKRYILTGILSLLVVSGLLVTAQSSSNESANGEGTLINEDGSRSQFSFNVRRNPNGKVTGQATLRNPSFKSGNGQNNQINIDVSCLKVEGDVAIIGGVTKRKNNQAKSEAVYFAVQDKGEAGDSIFRGFYYDDDPATEGDPQRCQTIETEVLVLEPVVAGTIEVKGKP